MFAYILSLISVYNSFSHSLTKTTFSVFLSDIFTRTAQIVVVLLYYYGILEHYQFVVGYICIFLAHLLLLFLYRMWVGKRAPRV